MKCTSKGLNRMSQEDIISKILPHASTSVRNFIAHGNATSIHMPLVGRGILTLVGLFFVFWIEWIVTAVLHRETYSSVFEHARDGTYLTFFVAVYIAYGRTLEIIASRKEAETRATTQTSDLKNAPDGDIEIMATIKSTNGVSKSPIFNIECLAYSSTAAGERSFAQFH